MATAAHRAAVQTALLSVRGLRRRRLGHVSPTDFPQNGLDKWGRKRLDYNNNNNSSNHPPNYYTYNGTISPSLSNKSLSPLLNGGTRRPAVPRATLVLGGGKSTTSKSRRNGMNSSGGGGDNLENSAATMTSTTTHVRDGEIDNTHDEKHTRLDLPHLAMEQQQEHAESFSQTNAGFTVNATDDDDDVATVTVPLIENMNGTVRHADADRANKRGSNTRSRNSSNDNTSRRRKKYSSDLIVILDMDECLIHSQFLSDRCVDKYRQVEDRPTKKSYHSGREEGADSLLFTNVGCDSFRIHLPDGDLVNVNKRPNLDIFLTEITSKFETYIFTAAVEVSTLFNVWHSVLFCCSCNYIYHGTVA